MNLFYTPELAEHSRLVNLDKEESFHCVRSLRMRPGDTLLLTNGRGLIADAILSEASPTACEAEVMNLTKHPRPDAELQMAVAPTKNHDRFEWFAEKATELGIGAIIPLICERSERKKVQRERLHRLLVAALKQSQGAYLPLLHDETSFKSFIDEAWTGQKFIAWCSPEPVPLMKDLLRKGESLRILIGPEGDFSEEEVKMALNSGYQPISLGKNRLRTETAALAACHIFNIINS
jgi:16S rRNA (uracil1498-N3)-methyltransferase